MAPDRLFERTLAATRDLQRRALKFEAQHEAAIAAAEPHFRDSARNLVHYLSVRQRDIRDLQQSLHALGLSSLGILEPHVLASLSAVIRNLEQLAGVESTPLPAPPVDMRTGPLLLRDHARRLLGPARRLRSTRIMVTMPAEAAHDVGLLVALMQAGMDVMRINCAHDDAGAWRSMARNLREAERVVGRRCRIMTDLAGPKVRTGSLHPIGHFVKLKPRRDALGRTVAAGKAWLTPVAAPEVAPSGHVALPVPDDALERLATGDRLVFEDLRGKRRELHVEAVAGRSRIASTTQTAYVGAGGACTACRDDAVVAQFEFGSLPGVVQPIELRIGDHLQLTRDAAPGRPAVRSADGTVETPARIHCTLGAAFDTVQVGQPVWFDDGKIGGTVTASDSATIAVCITQTPPAGGKLGAEKGINFPETDLGVPSLTARDKADLRVVVEFADMVALSFLREASDVEALSNELLASGAGHLGIVLKIENQAGFRNLPRILLASLRTPPVGVMVARGDLAVEVGFDRLSEVQEEILWLCEAAHVPVIWATQVLEGLAKAGAPTRAEVSDAVMSSRAECVMLNKGPRIVSTVEFLADLLGRMAEHHDKRMALLRRLSVSDL